MAIVKKKREESRPTKVEPTPEIHCHWSGNAGTAEGQ
jgi:hypothetical protein